MPPDDLPRHCAGCGYRLDGLPVEGRCPECGRRHSGGEVVLFGWGHGPRATLANGRGWAGWRDGLSAVAGVMLALVAAAVFLAAVTPTKLRGGGGSTVAGWLGCLAVSVGAALAVGAYAAWARVGRRGAGRPPPVVARLGPGGWGQRDGIGPTAMRPWHAGQRVRVEPIGGASNGGASDGGASAEARPYRVSIDDPARIVPPTGIDLDVDLTPPAADALRRRMEAWRGVARPGRAVQSGA